MGIKQLAYLTCVFLFRYLSVSLLKIVKYYYLEFLEQKSSTENYVNRSEWIYDFSKHYKVQSLTLTGLGNVQVSETAKTSRT